MHDLIHLEKLGLDPEIREKIDPGKALKFQVARVIAVNKNSFVVSNGINEIFSEVSGKFLFNVENPADFPAVGDWVYIETFNDESFGVIHEIFPRKSLLKRKSSGKKIEHQLIAANIDTGIIMQAADSNYNLRRLERYLVMINESRIRPIMLLSKRDLLSSDELRQKESEISGIFPELKVISFSSMNPSDIEKVSELLVPGKTFCLLGSSGVGKTTLINQLLNEEKFKTLEIREKDGRGKHATTRRELVTLKNGAIIIDNPGMRELGLISAEPALENTFSELAELSGRCRFNDCTHTVEEGCAILFALSEGTVSKERYRSYIKMRKESEYNEMSYAEKRQKDKKFGKYIHSIIKQKKDKRN